MVGLGYQNLSENKLYTSNLNLGAIRMLVTHLDRLHCSGYALAAGSNEAERSENVESKQGSRPAH